MLEAKDNGSPVVLLGGAVPTVEKGTGTLQDSTTLQIMGHCAKWAQRVDHTFRIADHIATAFRHATSGAPGPAYLEIPYDVSRDLIDERDLKIQEFSRTEYVSFGDPEAVERAAELLANAKNPVMVIGSTARYFAKHGEAVAELVNYLKMPVATQHGQGGVAKC